MLVFGDIFVSLLFSFVCYCLFELYIKKERGCLLVKMLYLLSKGSVDFLEPNTSHKSTMSHKPSRIEPTSSQALMLIFSHFWVACGWLWFAFGLWNDPTHCQLIFNHLYFASFEAMQCPDVVVANLDTHSFLGKQTVHVSEVV